METKIPTRDIIIIDTWKPDDYLKAKKINEICLPENYSEEFWKKIYDSAPRFQFCASKRNSDGTMETVGYILLWFDHVNIDLDETIKYRYNITIASLAVLPEYRRSGIASSLLEKVKYIAEIYNTTQKEARIFNLELHVREDNKEAQELYKKMGFTKVKEIPKYYSNPEKTAWVMQCSIYHTNK